MGDLNNDLVHDAVTVGATSTTVVSAEDFTLYRNYLLLINDSNETIYLNVAGGAAVLNQGVRLNANGGSILFDTLVPSRGVKGICASGSKVLLVTRDPAAS